MRILLLSILAVLFIQCGSDDAYKVDTLKINDKEHVLPRVSGDVKEIEDYLNHICSDVIVEKNGEKTTLIAKLTSAESELFKEFKYEISTYNDYFQGVSLNYIYRDLSNTPESTRKQIVEYIENNTKIAF